MELTASKDERTGRWNIPELEPSEKTFERMCEMLRTGQQFSFARYGDGEFFCMSGKQGHNCDKHEYFSDLGIELSKAFYSDPQYMVGIQPLSVKSGLYKKAADLWSTSPANIYNADTLHNASIDGNIPELFKALEGRPFVVVGPAHLSKVGEFFIEIPYVNCWLQFNQICIKICESLLYQRAFKINPVILLCASMMSEVIIEHFKDSEATFVDVGSCLDPYYGKLSRSYHHKLKL